MLNNVSIPTKLWIEFVSKFQLFQLKSSNTPFLLMKCLPQLALSTESHQRDDGRPLQIVAQPNGKTLKLDMFFFFTIIIHRADDR